VNRSQHDLPLLRGDQAADHLIKIGQPTFARTSIYCKTSDRPSRTSFITHSTFLFTRGTTLRKFHPQSEETFCAPSFNRRSTSIFQRSQIKPQRRCLPSFASMA